MNRERIMKRHSQNLLQRMLDGDETCYQDIIAWYVDDVLRLCYLLLENQEEAEDIVQETMLRLVRQVMKGKFRRANGSIKGFLMTTAKNICLNRLKKRRDFYSLKDECIEQNPIQQTICPPDVETDRRRFSRAFDQALMQLTGLQRTILVLHELQGESHADIAKTLRLSVECVRTHFSRARKRMRQILQPFCGINRE